MWKDLSQFMIQWWIEHISHHIQKVICLKEVNEYHEKALNDKKNWVQWTENEQQWSQQYVRMTVRVKKAAEIVKAVKTVKTVNNNVENVDESEWDSDVVIDLW